MDGKRMSLKTTDKQVTLSTDGVQQVKTETIKLTELQTVHRGIVSPEAALG